MPIGGRGGDKPVTPGRTLKPAAVMPRPGDDQATSGPAGETGGVNGIGRNRERPADDLREMPKADTGNNRGGGPGHCLVVGIRDSRKASEGMPRLRRMVYNHRKSGGRERGACGPRLSEAAGPVSFAFTGDPAIGLES